MSQFDIGLFANDDWRVRPNLTFSYGVRYEAQTNIGDHGDISPRIGIAWGVDGNARKAAKTIVRAGFGIFYDRIADSLILNALRYNGQTQQSYVVFSPSFYPAIPALSVLAAGRQPQQLQFVDSAIRAPRNYQASIGVDRQVNSYFRLSVNYVTGRGVHLQRSRDINAPINGLYPFGDQQLRLLTETTGFSRTNQLMISPNLNYKKLFLFGFYSLSYGNSDAEGQAADPYNLRAEWGPSSFAGVRHRFVVGTSIPLVYGVSVSPFIVVSSGSPYNITTGRDTNGDGFMAERPALVAGATAATCTGTNLVYEAGLRMLQRQPGGGYVDDRAQFRDRSGQRDGHAAPVAQLGIRRQERAESERQRPRDGTGRRRTSSRRRRTTPGWRWRRRPGTGWRRRPDDGRRPASRACSAETPAANTRSRWA